jgi:tetratricopeptide (TPR) repeat protein
MAEADKLLAANQTEAALAQLDRALRFAPDHPVIHRRLGAAYRDAARSGRAMKHLAAAIERAPNDLAGQMMLGDLYASVGRAAEARRAFRTALMCAGAGPANPASAKALNRLAELLEADGQYQAALDAYDVLTSWLDSQAAASGDQADGGQARVDIPLHRGRLLIRLGRFDEAIDVLADSAETTAGGHRDALVLEALTSLGRVAEAEELLEKFAAAEANHIEPGPLVGAILRGRIRNGQAAQGIRWAAALANRRQGWAEEIARAVVAAAPELAKDAPRKLAAGIEGTESDSVYAEHFLVALLAETKGQWHLAADQLNRCISHRDTFLPAHEALAIGWLKRRRADLAAQSAERAAELAGGGATAAYLRGRVHLYLGETDKAVAAFNEAVDVNDSYVPARLMLAKVYEWRREWAKSASHLNAVLGKEPTRRGVLRDMVEMNWRMDRLASVTGGLLPHLADKYPEAIEVRLARVLAAILRGQAAEATTLAAELAEAYPDDADVQLTAVIAELAADSDRKRTGRQRDTSSFAALNVFPAESDIGVGHLDDDVIVVEICPGITVKKVDWAITAPGGGATETVIQSASRASLASALVRLRAMVRRWPDDKAVGIAMCRVLTAMDRKAEALDLWREMFHRHEGDWEAMWGYALALAGRKDYNELVDIMKQLLIRQRHNEFAQRGVLLGLVRAGRYDEAIEYLQSESPDTPPRDKEPDGPEQWEEVIRRRMMMEMGGSTAAKESRPDRQTQLIVLHVLAGRMPEALRLISERMGASEDYEDRQNLARWRLAILFNLGRVAEARKVVDESYSYRRGELQKVWLELARRNKRYDEALAAIDDWRDDSQQRRDQPDFNQQKIKILIEAGRYDQAHAVLDEWLSDRLNPQREEYLAMKVAVYLATDDIDGAIEFVFSPTGRGGGLPVHTKLLNALLAKQRFEDIRTVTVKWGREEPTNVALAEGVVGLLIRQDQVVVAMGIVADWSAELDKRITVKGAADPPPALTADRHLIARRELWQLLVGALGDSGLHAEAGEQGLAYLAGDPNCIEVVLVCSLSLEQADRGADAQAMLERALKVVRSAEFVGRAGGEDGGTPSVRRRRFLASTILNNLGYVYADQGVKLDEAEAMIRQAVAMNGTVNELDSLAWVLYKKNKQAEAEKVFKNALAMLAKERDGYKHPLIYDHAGDVHYRLGKHDLAANMWRQAAAIARQMDAPTRYAREVLARAPKKLAAMEEGLTPAVAPLGEGVADPLAKPEEDATSEPPPSDQPAGDRAGE